MFKRSTNIALAFVMGVLLVTLAQLGDGLPVKVEYVKTCTMK